jgi:hypothetical protein
MNPQSLKEKIEARIAEIEVSMIQNNNVFLNTDYIAERRGLQWVLSQMEEEETDKMLNEFGCKLLVALATGKCEKNSNAIAEFVRAYLNPKQN